MADQTDPIKDNWDTIWKYFSIVDKGYKLFTHESFEFALVLRECEAALKDRAIKAYVREKMKARQARKRARRLKKGGTKWNSME